MSGGTPPVTGRVWRTAVGVALAGAAIALAGCAAAPAASDAAGIVTVVEEVASVDDAYAEYGFSGLPSNRTLLVVAQVPDYATMEQTERTTLYRAIAEAMWRTSVVEVSSLDVYVTPEPLPGGGRPEFAGVDHSTYGKAKLSELFGPWEKPE